MTDYISRESVLMLVQDSREVCANPSKELAFIREDILALPAADVREVKRGKWKKILQNADGTSDYECSVCLGILIDVPDDDEHPLCNFCPNCGADMREES